MRMMTSLTHIKDTDKLVYFELDLSNKDSHFGPSTTTGAGYAISYLHENLKSLVLNFA